MRYCATVGRTHSIFTHKGYNTHNTGPRGATVVREEERTQFSPIKATVVRNTIRNSGWGVRHSEGTQPTVHWSITVLGHTDEGPTRDKCTLLNPKDCWDRDGTQPTTQWSAAYATVVWVVVECTHFLPLWAVGIRDNPPQCGG